MNAFSPPRARLAIEVVFDLVCPWCFLGTRRLRRALRARPDVAAAVAWRPFLLNPDAVPRGLVPGVRPDGLRRFGGEERARRLNATLTEIGRAEGVPFRFELMRRVPPSLDAHRLVRFADRHGRAEEAVDSVFVAHFASGADISDPATLLALGTSVGLERTPLRNFLASSAEAEAVHAENLRAHRLGINGVPCFVVAGAHAIAGAQEPEVLERLLDVAIAEAGEATAA